MEAPWNGQMAGIGRIRVSVEADPLKDEPDFFARVSISALVVRLTGESTRKR
jgi:hypothetical protein